jgi:hypothetical protein
MTLIKNLTLVLSSLLITACGDEQNTVEPVIGSEISVVPVTNDQLPSIEQLTSNVDHLGNYEKLELSIELTAQFDNPYDQRQVSLDVLFTAPDGQEVFVTGFWDAANSWQVRFTPSQVGQWQYDVTVTDTIGKSKTLTNTFTVTESTNTGWLQQGSQVNPAYSAHYFVHHDGSPFYGLGHGDVFAVFSAATDIERLFTRMQSAKENYFVWWPQFYFSFSSTNYNNYDLSSLTLIDEVLTRTENAGLFMVFTLWDHSQLRDDSHPWSDGRWWLNGFRHLTSANEFFTNDEAWQWQKNWYRYTIARWGYSPAIAMWQTVSEINGTNAFANTEPWHQQVNDYFVAHDPYRHPTTASKSGDISWFSGHQVMDVPQVHIYSDLLSETETNRLGEQQPLVIDSANVIAQYNQDMWQNNNKPSWIGEFGVQNKVNTSELNYYPELFHHAIWAALASGSAMTPAEWNDFDTWGTMTSQMQQHMAALATFVADMPLAQWQVEPLTVNTSIEGVRAWGMAGGTAGFVWLQDNSLAGLSIDKIRAQSKPRNNIAVSLTGLTPGYYQVMPYDTWQGEFMDTIELDCFTPSLNCTVTLPSFTHDIAFKFQRL